jgi:predicted aconitase with swiveling domain
MAKLIDVQVINPMSETLILRGRPLVPGTAEGTVMKLNEPLSLWGGLEPRTGEIIDRRHPNSGQIVTGRVLVLPSGRGSSSASSILLEAVRLNTAPAAIITHEVDGILALGAVVAREMYAQSPPLIVVEKADYALLRDGQPVQVHADGTMVYG